MSDLQQDVTNLIYRESSLLDRREWDSWIDLYTEDAVYWVPSWANEEETITDPELQLNLIYLRNRGGLEDRVFRIFHNLFLLAIQPSPALQNSLLN